MRTIAVLGVAGMLAAGTAWGSPEELLAGYGEAGGSGAFSAERGRAAWSREYPAPDGGAPRSCATCHGTDLGQGGRHVKTGKAIEPMGLSANPDRLSDPKKVEKWFRRNCRWTLGRECTSAEKGDFVRFIMSQ